METDKLNLTTVAGLPPMKTMSSEQAYAAIASSAELVGVLRSVDEYFRVIDEQNPTKDRGTIGRSVREQVRSALAGIGVEEMKSEQKPAEEAEEEGISM